MLHQGPSKRDWFESWEVRVWYMGSLIAILGMPLTTLISRRNLDQCEAWVFLVGSSASTATTLCFLYVLINFPIFIRHVKEEGADPDVVVRLATFYDLNVIRVIFRFFFTVPLLVLAIDGIHGRHGIITDPFWSDFLLVLGGIGCFISSAITLLIFFPRSITQETSYSAKMLSMSTKSPVVVSQFPTSLPTSPTSAGPSFRHHSHRRRPSSPIGTPKTPPSPRTAMSSFHYPLPAEDAPEATAQYEIDNIPTKPRRYTDQAHDLIQEIPYSESSHASHNVVIQAPPQPPPLQSNSQPDLHPYVMTFTSPIDLLDASEDSHGYQNV